MRLLYNPEIAAVLERMELTAVLEKHYGKMAYWYDGTFRIFGTGWAVSLEAAREIRKVTA